MVSGDIYFYFLYACMCFTPHFPQFPRPFSKPTTIPPHSSHLVISPLNSPPTPPNPSLLPTLPQTRPSHLPTRSCPPHP
ncbi:hypothetical protein EON65_47725 [archaeon]|nr:MAG: hypothetical protein EON65_47725 [archaeon]